MNPESGYFESNSVFWQVWKERIQILGAARAILLQLAHPLVSIGVFNHSHFQSDPLGRLERTLDTMLTIIFGNKPEANIALERLYKIHTTVKGKLPYTVGIFSKGTIYDANDPILKLWVHASLIDTGLLIHELFVKALNPIEKEFFYEDSKKLALLLGISQGLIPKTLSGFNQYMQMMLNGQTLFITPQTKKMANYIINPPIKFIPKPLINLINLITASSLPNDLQKSYRLKYDHKDLTKLKIIIKAIRLLLPLTPSVIRYAKQYDKTRTSKG